MNIPNRSFAFNLFAGMAIVLSVLSMIIKKGDDVLWINGHHSPFLDVVFTLITHLGNGVLFIPFTVLLLFAQIRQALLTVAVWVSHGLVCLLLKRVAFPSLKRPAALIDHDLLHFVPNVAVHQHYSFPSGHTATIVCFCFLLALQVRKKAWTVALLLIALAVAYSRIYLVEHFLLDVAAGCVIGVVVTWSWCKIFEHLNLPPWASGKLTIRKNNLALIRG